MKIVRETTSPTQTYEYAKSLAQDCKGGEVFCLDGDLGVGKTVFTKGFAEGLGICEDITSPTFAIVNTYYGDINLNHFDVYRLSSIYELDDIGFEEYIYDNKSVSLIEWGLLFKEALPSNTVYIKIEKDLTKGYDYRKITVNDEDISD